MLDLETWKMLGRRSNDVAALTQEIFQKMEPVEPSGFVSDLGYAAVGKDAVGFQILRRGQTENTERFGHFEEVLAYILRVYW